MRTQDSAYLLAYYFGGKPYIYVLELLKGGIAELVTDPFVAIGSGQNIASFILEGFKLAEMDINGAIGIAGYAVEMCKRHDQYCGGPLRYGMLSKHNEPSHPIFWSKLMIDAYMEAIAAVDDQWTKELPARISREVDKVAKKWQVLKDAGLMDGPLGPNFTPPSAGPESSPSSGPRPPSPTRDPSAPPPSPE